MKKIEDCKTDINWPTALYYINLHALGIYGLLLVFTEAKWMTIFFSLFIIIVAGLGITIGAHRLWAHGSFEASAFIRIFLIIGYTLAGIGSVYDWVLKHRTHHKYYGTENDPYNHKKGLLYGYFLSNVGTVQHNKNKIKKDIDMRDVDSDGYIWIQRWFYWLLYPVVSLFLPIYTSVVYFGESIHNSIFILGFFRFAVTTNISWLVNNAVLIWGLKPGDKYPIDDNSIFLLNKSYWPNYHYLLPWDYKCGEFGTYDRGSSTFFIKMFQNLGLIDSLKTVSNEAIRNALYASASKNVSVSKSLESVKKLADEDAVKEKLRYHH